MAQAVDYTVILSDVGVAISEALAHAYYTEALCRYENLDDLMETILCDCDGSGSECFASATSSPIGSFRVCPYQTVTVGTLDASVVVQSDSVPPAAGCQVVSISTTAVGKYQVPPDFSVTNQLFKSIQSNAYWIVENSNQAVVGQLISNAINVTIPYTPVSSLLMCIQTETFIPIISSANLLTLAQIKDDHTIQIYEYAIPYLATDADIANTNNSRLSVCGYVNGTGTFFAVAVVPNYADINPTPSNQTITAFCFYIVVIALALVQFTLLIIEREHVKLLPFKLVALSIIVLNGCARAVYILPPKNAFVGPAIESIAFIIYELPTFLYFSVFTVIMYLWTMVIINTRRFGRTKNLTGSKALFVALVLANVFMYFIFVVFIYLTAILPTKTQASPCFLGNLDSASSTVEHSIKVAYWIFQCVVSVLLCLGFLISATAMLKMIMSLRTGTLGSEQSNVSSKGGDVLSFQLLIITSVALVCIVFLLVRSILFLVVAVNNSSIQIMTFCMLEIIPQLMLLIYIRPPRFFMHAISRVSGATGRSLGADKSASTKAGSTITSKSRTTHSSNSSRA